MRVAVPVILAFTVSSFQWASLQMELEGNQDVEETVLMNEDRTTQNLTELDDREYDAVHVHDKGLEILNNQTDETTLIEDNGAITYDKEAKTGSDVFLGALAVSERIRTTPQEGENSDQWKDDQSEEDAPEKYEF